MPWYIYKHNTVQNKIVPLRGYPGGPFNSESACKEAIQAIEKEHREWKGFLKPEERSSEMYRSELDGT
jgi:hypothetical protein